MLLFFALPSLGLQAAVIACGTSVLALCAMPVLTSPQLQEQKKHVKAAVVKHLEDINFPKLAFGDGTKPRLTRADGRRWQV